MRDDDIDQIVKAARQSPPVTADGMHIVAMLALICRAIRDLDRRNAT